MRNLFIFTLLALVMFSCSQEEQTSSQAAPSSPVADNVVVLKDTETNLISNKLDLQNGTYIIKFDDVAPELEKGDIILGTEGKGYLRKVESYTQNGNTLSIETTQATLDDVFNDATISFDREKLQPYKRGNRRDININYMREDVSQNALEPYTFDFSNTTIFEDENISFKIPKGSISYDPSYNFEADYDFWRGLQSLEFNTDDSNVSINASFDVKSGAMDDYKYEETLVDFDETFVYEVAGIPIVLGMETTLVAEFNANASGDIDFETEFTSIFDIDAVVAFDRKNRWTSSFDIIPTNNLDALKYSTDVETKQRFTIRPVVKINFLGLVGPYTSFSAYEETNVNVGTENWDANILAGIDGTIGVDLSIFSYVYANYEWSDKYEGAIWEAPVALEAAGDAVKVVDSYGNPLAGVTVHMNNGQLVLSDFEGLAALNGATSAVIYKADGTMIDMVSAARN